MNNSHEFSTLKTKPLFTVVKSSISDRCSFCNNKAKQVPTSAINHFLKDEVKTKLSSLENFYFCSTPSCQVVYFKDNLSITLDDVKYSIGLKDNSYPATVCFCFNWTKEKIYEQIESTGDTSALEEIKEHVKNKSCSCEVQNPKGRCCMADVKKTIIELKNKLIKEDI